MTWSSPTARPWSGLKRVLRTPLPERVAGIDLFLRLLAEAESAGISVYFLGAKEQVLEEMLRRVADRFPV